LLSPVEQFYEDLKQKKIQEALLAAQGPQKRKRGRPRSKKQYFTEDTQAAIIAYNHEKNYELRNKVYKEHIQYPFEKLTENLIHRFKFYYFDYPTREVQHEVIVHLLEKLDKFTADKGKAFSYFSIVAKNWLILHNNNNYKNMIRKKGLEVIDKRRNVTNEVVREKDQEELHEFMNQFTVWLSKNKKTIVSKDRDVKILESIIEIFNRRSDIDNFNKKAIYIMIREMSDVKTQYITRVVNVIKQHFIEKFALYKNNGRF
jgi:hypothetical protein